VVWCGDMRTFPHRHFEVPEDPKALGHLFSVPDFVGLPARPWPPVCMELLLLSHFHKVLSVTSLSPPITPWSWYLFTHASPSHVTLSHCSVSQSSCVTSACVPTFCLCDLDLLRCHQNEVPHVPMSLCCLQEPLGHQQNSQHPCSALINPFMFLIVTPCSHCAHCPNSVHYDIVPKCSQMPLYPQMSSISPMSPSIFYIPFSHISPVTKYPLCPSLH